MKKCILSAIAGAAAMFFTILALAYIQNCREPAENEHVDFVSAIDRADCYLCGKYDDPTISAYWGEDNIAILDFNTFQMHRLEINRYGENGEPVTTPAGYFQPGIMETETGWLSIGESNPARFSRAAGRQYSGKLLENINGYSLRSFSCLGTLPLRENCAAPLGEEFWPILGADDAALLTQGKEDKPKGG